MSTKLLDQIKQKKKLVESYQPLSSEVINNLNNWFRVELTYSSNAIEGNTLSRIETSQVMEKGLAIPGKSLNEHLEVAGHAKAYDWILENSPKTPKKITVDTVLNIHRMILERIDPQNAGRLRSMSVRIAGSRAIMPNPAKVPKLMNDFIKWLHDSGPASPTLAANAHYKLVSIHPFVDGNGRTARLLMNLILLQAGYPPAIIQPEERIKYLESLEKAQLGGSLQNYYQIIYEAINNSLDVYVDAIENKKESPVINASKKQELMKIGELAAKTDEAVSTIRYWTQEGLLKVAGHTQGGYQLYKESEIERVKEIRRLQQEARLTIKEIKGKLLEKNR